MKTSIQIRKETEQMTFSQANEYIESLGFEMEIFEDYPFLKSWLVKNHREFYRIANYLESLEDDKADVFFAFYPY